MNLQELGSQEVGLYLRVAAIDRRRARSGRDLLKLRLADRTGELPATLFHDHHDFEMAAELAAGEIVAVRATRGQYQGSPQLEISRLRRLDERDKGHFEESDLLPETKCLAELGPDDAEVFLRTCSVEKRRTKADREMLKLRLADRTGVLPATMFPDHPDFVTAVGLAAGEVVAVNARRGQYDGAPQLEINRLRRVTAADADRWSEVEVFGTALAGTRDLLSEKLVIDIETAPLTDIRSMPQTLVEEVTRVAQEREWPIDKVLALNPLFSRVVSIALGDADGEGGCVLFAPLAEDLDDLRAKAPEWLRPLPEAEMLGAAWALMSAAQTVITFNGRSFDLPFMRNRSAILGVPVTTDLLSQPPYQHAPHLDIYQVLSGGSGPAARPMNLDAACFAFGITSPKGTMDGSMVAQAYGEKRYLEIAKYNLADIDATRQLYRQLKPTVIDFLT